MSQTPSVGRMVHYLLDEGDVDLIDRTRVITSAKGNMPQVGDQCSAVITRVLPNDNVNLKVFLDGEDTFWAPGRQEGTLPGNWIWPAFVPPVPKKEDRP